MVNSVPVLESKRLILRGHRLTDFPACAAMWADPIVTRHIGGKPFTEQQAWLKLLAYVGHWSLMQFGYWVVELKQTGRYIGEMGFANFHRRIDAEIDSYPELGWALTSDVHGQGLATEGLNLALEWRRRHLVATKIACIIEPSNVASIRVAQKLGFQELKHATYLDTPLIVYIRD